MNIWNALLLLSTAPLAGESPAAEPGLPLPGEFDAFYAEFFKMLGLLGLIILFLLFIAWFCKRIFNQRLQQGNSNSVIQVVERRQLTARTTVYVLDVMGKRAVIAETPEGVTTITAFCSEKL
jgi:flagellar biogenesis protein FliO